MLEKIHYLGSLLSIFISSALFPFPALWNLLVVQPPPTPPTIAPYDTQPEDYVGVLGSVVKDVVLGLIFYIYTMDLQAAKELQISWIWPIIIRDLLLSAFVAGGWDYLLYFSSYSSSLLKYKTNPAVPPVEQFKRDAIFTGIGTLTASLMEIYVLNLWAKGYLSYYPNFWDFPMISILSIVTMPYWRHAHFWLIHRFLHPWRIPYIPDIGAFLFKYVHLHHHRSYNPTALSGISMQPVEIVLYYSAAVVPYFFFAHPLLFAITKVDLTIGAMIGHDGFHEPIGSGSYFHYLHHKYFEINYGDKMMPIDWLVGTYSEGPQEPPKTE